LVNLSDQLLAVKIQKEVYGYLVYAKSEHRVYVSEFKV